MRCLARYSLVLVVLVGGASPATAQTLLSHYPFDDGPANGGSYAVGETIPDAASDHDLTVVNAEVGWTADGQVNGAAQFDGVDGFLEDTDAEAYLNGQDNLTVVVWVKSNTIATNNGILTSQPPDDDDQNLSLRYDDSGDLGGKDNVIKGGINTEGGKQEYETESGVQTTDWQFLALVYEDGKPLQLYADGDFAASSYEPVNASGKTAGATTLRVGQGAKQAGDIWDGRIDDLRIYGDALTKAELDEIYSTTLPVELTAFRVQSDGGDAELTWTTGSETNNAGFRVEHRAPASSEWTRRRFVSGAGTTTQSQTYRSRLEELGPGTHRFRLVQVDLDGTTHVHESKSVSIRAQSPLFTRLGPNPARDASRLRLRLSRGGPVTVALYNVLGQRVRVLHDGRLAGGQIHQFSVPTATLSSGQYLVRVSTERRTRTERLMVVK